MFCFQMANISVANSGLCATPSPIAEFSEDQKINRAITPGRGRNQTTQDKKRSRQVTSVHAYLVCTIGGVPQMKPGASDGQGQ